MNKLVSRFTALAAFALGCSAPLSAATFDFSYVFGGGETATGSFEGTLNGDIVEDISNISLVLNGVAITGPVQATGLYSGYWFGEAVVGFSVYDSNFIFTDRDPPPANGGYVPGDHFFFITELGLSTASSYIDANQTSEFAVNANGGSSGWTLTERTTQTPPPSVPDTASTAALLGLALAGAIAARRRLAVTHGT